MKFPELTEVEGQIEAKRKELGELFGDALPGSDGTLDVSKIKGYGDSADVAAAMKALNDELTDLGTKRDKLATAGIAAENVKKYEQFTTGESGDETPTGHKSIGAQIAGSDAVKRKGTKVDLPDVRVKTLFQRSAGWTPESTRSGLVVMSAQRPVQVTDLLMSLPTNQAAYKYMEESTFTNAAAERAEGDAYAESTLALTERSVTIESIGTFLPVTDEQLEDEEGAAAYIDARLPFMVRQRLDGQILTGDGSTPNILGINNKASIQTQALGADVVPDAVYKAMTKVKVTGRAFPNAAVFHPNDWQGVRLLRTADGIYIWGSPSEAGPARIWGIQVVESDAQTENTAVVGDFENFSMLVIRRGMEVRVSDSHSDYFVKGKQAVRAGIRCATVWTRAAAFCTVTGI